MAYNLMFEPVLRERVYCRRVHLTPICKVPDFSRAKYRSTAGPDMTVTKFDATC